MSRRKNTESGEVGEYAVATESNGDVVPVAKNRTNPPRYWIMATHTGTGAVRKLGEYKTLKTARRSLEQMWGFASESFTGVRIMKVKQSWPEIRTDGESI